MYRKALYDIKDGIKGVSTMTLLKLKTTLDVSVDWLLEGIK